MASSPFRSWQIEGEKVETLIDFIFLGSKIIADGDWSHEIKRYLVLGRKAMINIESILKSKDITLPTKIRIVKAMVFSSSHVWMWELDHKECWVPKTDAFELWCWRRLLRVPWTARRSNYLVLKEISPEYWLEGLMLKMKLPYFGHLMWRLYSLEKIVMLGDLKAKGESRGRVWDG